LNLSRSKDKYFDIIGFDPRGVNNTTPRLKCFPNAFNQQAWLLGLPDYSLLWDSDSVLGLMWAKSQAVGRSCSQEQNENDMIRHVNTAQVAEDMVEIVERHAEWRENEARRLIGGTRLITTEQMRDILERTAWKVGNEQLQYWGVSYGSLLGQTFAAMHPDRVGRLAIDGVMNPVDYYNGYWLANLQDSDNIIAKFCDYCFEAGPTKCPLYTGTSGRDIEARFEEIVFRLKDNPIPVLSSRGAEVVTFGDVLLKVMTAMCFPYAAAESMFRLIADIKDGNVTNIADGKQASLEPAGISLECLRDGPYSDACLSGNYISGIGANQMIGCMDGALGGGRNLTKSEFKRYLALLKQQSKWYSPGWSHIKMACVGVNVEPAWVYEGE
jgi:hypothetical protein